MVTTCSIAYQIIKIDIALDSNLWCLDTPNEHYLVFVYYRFSLQFSLHCDSEQMIHLMFDLLPKCINPI
jgi:hypothetical protein